VDDLRERERERETDLSEKTILKTFSQEMTCEDVE
jgi:hypothetical protein